MKVFELRVVMTAIMMIVPYLAFWTILSSGTLIPSAAPWRLQMESVYILKPNHEIFLFECSEFMS